MFAFTVTVTWLGLSLPPLLVITWVTVTVLGAPQAPSSDEAAARYERKAATMIEERFILN